MGSEMCIRDSAMVEAARAVGVPAKFAGSGGAIVGTYDSPAQLDQLREQLTRLGCEVIVPQIG